MLEQLDFGNKIENGGATSRGRVAAPEINALINRVNEHSTHILKVINEDLPDTLKQLDGKVGLFHYDADNNRVIAFANEEARDAYLDDPTQTHLILGAFDAPFNYSASINLLSPTFVSLLDGTKNNYVDFTFDTVNKQGASIGEPVIVTYTFIKNGNKKIVTEIYQPNTQVHFKVDDYLTVGTTYLQIAVTGQNTLAATTVGITYLVVDLQLTDTYNLAQVYTPATTMVAEFPYNVSGYGTKVMEWFVDGELLDFVKAEDEILDITTTRTKYIDLSLYGHGRHSVQYRSYVILDGERFYSDVLYRDVIVDRGEDSNPIIAIGTIIPSGEPIVTDSARLYGMTQYVPYNLQFTVYNPRLIGGTETKLLLSSTELAVLFASNGTVNTVGLRAPSYGSQDLTITAEETVYNLIAEIAQSSISIEEITAGLELDLQAIGRTNNDVNKDDWSYSSYNSSFHGFEWNNQSGWVNNRLLINKGAHVDINIAPFASDITRNGGTYEFEFETRNVTNDDAVICDLRAENGAGLLITASEAKLSSSNNSQVSTRFKSGENIRVSFVVNRRTGVTNKGLVFVYVNAVLSGAIDYKTIDDFLSTATLKIGGTTEAEVAVKSLRFYNNALNSEQILNNYILYRDTMDDMFDVYDSNNIYIAGTQVISVDAIAAKVPVMIFTGNIPELEATTDKNKTIYVDIEYINMQDPTKSFTTKNTRMRPQGTSSMGYPKKNFRIYTNYGTMWDYQGNVIQGGLYSFKEQSQPVSCWCFKADYAESSGTHNTGVARLLNDVIRDMQIDGEYLGRTEAQKAAIANNYDRDVRTTVDGMPVVLLYRLTPDSDLIFIGKYNFNNDKSTESVYGFRDIPGYDNSKTQCWEVLNNGNHLALFQDTDNFDNEWDEAFEARYPDGSDDVSDLKELCSWISSTNTSPKAFGESLSIEAEVKEDSDTMYGSQEKYAQNGSYEDNAENRLKKFIKEKWDHLDVFKTAATYVYKLRFAAVDQMVKNVMQMTEGVGSKGTKCKWFDILYDNDTINGTRNDGYLRYLWDITRKTLDTSFSSEVYAFAGHDSVLYNNLEADEEFMRICSVVDNAMYMAGLSYSNVIKMFNDEQAGKWCERIYNQDAQYKYIGPFTDNGVNNLFMLQGNRSLHRQWWLSKRFDLMDSLFVSGEYKSKSIEFKVAAAPAGIKFNITAGSKLYYGYGVNNVVTENGHFLDVNDTHEYTTKQVLNVGDPVRLYGARSIKKLDISNFAPYISVLNISEVWSDVTGTCLEELEVGNSLQENTSLEHISGLNKATKLKVLNIRGCKGITSLDLLSQTELAELRASKSGLLGVVLSDGAPIKILELPDTMSTIQLVNKPNLETIIVENGGTKIRNIEIKNCPLIDSQSFVFDWLENKESESKLCSINIEGANWTLSTSQMLDLLSVKGDGGQLNLKGCIYLTSVTLELLNVIRDNFGEGVFSPDSELYISGADYIDLTVQPSILEGGSTQCTAFVFSEKKGSVNYYLLDSNNAEVTFVEGATINTTSGLLTISETGVAKTLKVIAKHTSTDNVISRSESREIVVITRVYPNSVSINGLSTLSATGEYTYNLSFVSSGEVNGDYRVEYTLTGDAVTGSWASLGNYSNSACIVKCLNIPEGDDEFTAVLTCKAVKVSSGAVICQDSKNITVGLPEVIIMTSESNPVMMAQMYTRGHSASQTQMTNKEAAKLTHAQVRTAVQNVRSNLTHFNELEHFTKINKINEGVSSQSIFYYCSSLTSLTIPPPVTELGSYAFYYCSSLTNANFIPEWIDEIPNGCFQQCGNFKIIDNTTIPSNIKKIGVSAYANIQITKIDIPATIEEIGDSAFSYASYSLSGTAHIRGKKIGNSIIGSGGNTPKMDTIRYHEGIEEIGDYAYSGLRANGTIYFPSTLKKIGVGPTKADVVLNVYLDDNNENFTFEDNCFATKDKKKILSGTFNTDRVPDWGELEELGDYCFSTNSKITSAIIPSNVRIGRGAFSSCTALQQIQLNDSIESLSYDLSGCSNLRELNVPDSVKSITQAFENCASLKRVTGCNGLETLNMRAFYRCANLEYVHIGKNVTYIGDYIFQDSANIKVIEIEAEAPPRISSIGFKGFIPDDTEIRVPRASYSDYLTATNWSVLSRYLRPYFLEEDINIVVSYSCNGLLISSENFTIGKDEVPLFALNPGFLSSGHYVPNGINEYILEGYSKTYDVACLESANVTVNITPKDVDGNILAENLSCNTLVPIGLDYTYTLPDDCQVLTVNNTEYYATKNEFIINYDDAIGDELNIDVLFAGHKVQWEGNWLLSNTDVYGEHSYKSNAIGHSESTAQRAVIKGASRIVFSCRSYGESNYDYLTIGNINAVCSRTVYKYTLKGSASATVWKDYTYELPNTGEHFIEFCYSKDNGGVSGDDACYVYVKSIE